MSLTVEPPQSVLLLVGREDFTPPTTFGGKACAATADCLAIAVVSGAPVLVSLGPVGDTGHLVRLDEFDLESEGHLSLRDVYSREYETVGVEPGLSTVTLWANDADEPSELVLTVHGL